MSSYEKLYQILYDQQLPPFDKFHELVAIHEELEEFHPKMMYPILDPQSWSSRHQTLVVFEVTESPSWTWQERATRLATSFNNQQTIKVDIMSSADGDLYEGLVWTGKVPGGISASDLMTQSKTWGYNQVLIHHYIGAT
jgi:hypothetical protein